jgi:uncharacterized protein with PQ loop repeat
MSIVSVISAAAILVGLLGVIPQIISMLRGRSAAGQSALSWTLGVGVNILMFYVNMDGYDAPLLALGNVIGAILSTVALGCVLWLNRYSGAPRTRVVRPPVSVTDLPTGEFWAVHNAIVSERQHRELPQRDTGGGTTVGTVIEFV